MKLFRREEYGYDLIISRFLRIFWDYGYFFCYIELPHYTIRISPHAGHYIFDKKTKTIIWED